MRNSTIPKGFAQNSIAYIVYSNPAPVRSLLYDCGYEPPKNIHHLVEATKELVQKNGTAIISKLMEVHPDKKAILSLQKKEAPKKGNCNSCSEDNYLEEDNFCGSCGHSNYMGSGDEDSFLDQFSDTSDKELEKYYHRIVKKSNASPKDAKLAGEVQMVWNELRQRRLLQTDTPSKEDTPITIVEKPKSNSFNKEELLFIGLSFLGGFMLCSVLKK